MSIEIQESLEPIGTLSVDERMSVLRDGGTKVLRLRGAAARPMPSHVRDAVAEALEDYAARPLPRGDAQLRKAFADKVAMECGLAYDPETEVLVTNGAMQALSVCFRAILAPGDKVIVPSPAFFFGGPIHMAGGEPVYVPASKADGWRWDLEAIERAIDERTKALVICNPCNPTGYVPSRPEIEAAVDLARRHGVLIVTDESYERYVYDGASINSVLSTTGAREGTVLIRSMSKSFSMSPWRIGFLAAPAPLLDACANILEWECLRVGHVAQRAATAAIQGPHDWLDDIVPEYQRNRQLAFDAVSKTEVLSCVWPQGCPFLFLDLSQLKERDGRSPEEQLIEAGIPAVPGRHFQSPGHSRLPFGGELSELQALDSVLHEWSKQAAA